MQRQADGLNRRDVLLAATAGVIATAALSGTAQASGEHAHEATPNQDVIDSSLHCLKTGQACVAHSLESFKAGDTSLAGCAASVQQMLAMCGALANMASLGSTHLKSLAEVCAAVCMDCEKECRKHADTHAACKACADSCVDCIKKCQALKS